jgi:predicted nucleic acid-binding protein
MAVVVLDTDAASRFYRGREHVGAEMAAVIANSPFALTFVSVAELHLWAEMRSWGRTRRDELEQWLDTVPVLWADAEVSATWGRLTSAARLRGRPRPTNDTWIAACCICEHGATAHVQPGRFRGLCRARWVAVG